MKSDFTVQIHCKPYVKRFLEINFGDPVILSSNPHLHRFFRNCLKKPSKRYENRYQAPPSIHSECVEIKIQEDDFYRYGWCLSKTDQVKFGKEIEGLAKVLMRNMVGLQLALKGQINISIHHFQNHFEFPEDIWSYETIKKDFYRNGYVNRIDFENEISMKLEQIILVNLSDQGTLSQLALNQYEFNQ